MSFVISRTQNIEKYDLNLTVFNNNIITYVMFCNMITKYNVTPELRNIMHHNYDTRNVIIKCNFMTKKADHKIYPMSLRKE